MKNRNYRIRETRNDDIEATIELRGRTRENPVSRSRLQSLGITQKSIYDSFDSGECKGFVCALESEIIGFCNGDATTGEVLVLAVAPEHEGQGIGSALLGKIVDWLSKQGHSVLWLAADPDPAIRAYGFYRAQGWRSTGLLDQHGDERLELVTAQAKTSR